MLESDPGDAAARSHRAYAHRKRGDHAAAVADYSAALAAAPAAVRLYNNRGLRQTPRIARPCASSQNSQAFAA